MLSGNRVCSHRGIQKQSLSGRLPRGRSISLGPYGQCRDNYALQTENDSDLSFLTECYCVYVPWKEHWPVPSHAAKYRGCEPNHKVYRFHRQREGLLSVRFPFSSKRSEEHTSELQ